MSNYKLGIDTSSWQSSKVDYFKAKQQGVSFAFLRIGCGKTKDKCFEQDYAACIAAGIKVGVYIYSYAMTETEAIQDATRVLGWLNDRHLDFPIALDLEEKKQGKVERQIINTAMYNAFKKKIEENNVYDAILYTGEYWYNHYFEKNQLKDDLWIAKYSNYEPNVGRQVAVWQFSSSAISTTYWNGKLDRDYMMVDSFSGSRPNIITHSYNPYPEPTRNLRKTVPCMKGNDVKWLQWELGFVGSAVDGIFGNDTKNALGIFQKAHGLKVDYICGPATRYALKND